MSSSVLEVRNLKRVVEDGRVIITNLTFSLHSPGDVLFIRGASGVGKSLLLRVLACLDSLQVSFPSRQSLLYYSTVQQAADLAGGPTVAGRENTSANRRS